MDVENYKTALLSHSEGYNVVFFLTYEPEDEDAFRLDIWFEYNPERSEWKCDRQKSHAAHGFDADEMESLYSLFLESQKAEFEKIASFYDRVHRLFQKEHVAATPLSIKEVRSETVSFYLKALCSVEPFEIGLALTYENKLLTCSVKDTEDASGFSYISFTKNIPYAKMNELCDWMVEKSSLRLQIALAD